MPKRYYGGSLLILPRPSSPAGIGTKLGIDATAPAGSLQESFKPIAIPGEERMKLEDYL